MLRHTSILCDVVFWVLLAILVIALFFILILVAQVRGWSPPMVGGLHSVVADRLLGFDLVSFSQEDGNDGTAVHEFGATEIPASSEAHGLRHAEATEGGRRVTIAYEPTVSGVTGQLPFSVVPPCTPWPGSDRDPCERRVPWEWPELEGSLVAFSYLEPDPVPTIREAVDKGFESSTKLPHQVVRGVVVPGSTRCTPQIGRAVTRSDLEGEVLWRPGGSNIRCFVDVSVREYLVGGGPVRITIQAGWRNNDHSYPDYATVPRDDAYFADISSPLSDGLEGYEWMFWLEVPFDPTSGAWDSSMNWSVQRKGDGSIVAVDWWSGEHSKQEIYADRLEIPLDRYAVEVKSARSHYDELYDGRVSASPTSPAIIATSDRSSLTDYLRSIGTYEVEGFTPQPPPPAPVPTDPPVGLGAALGANSQIDLSWAAPSVAGVTGYKVVRRVPKGEFITVVADTGTMATTYTDTSAPMTAGVTYIYRVIALNQYGESLASNRATVRLH